MKHSPPVGAGRLLELSVGAATLPVRAPIFPTDALASELFGQSSEWSTTTWTNQIQDRRNVISREKSVSRSRVHSPSQRDAWINIFQAISLPHSLLALPSRNYACRRESCKLGQCRSAAYAEGTASISRPYSLFVRPNVVTAAIRAKVRRYTLGHHGSKSGLFNDSAVLLIWLRVCSRDLGGAAYVDNLTRRNGNYGFAELNHQRSEEKVTKTSIHDTEPQIKNEEPQDITVQIRARAYELYLLRGQSDGHDLDDWLLAESQLIQKLQAKDS